MPPSVLHLLTLLLGSGSILSSQNDFRESVTNFTVNVAKARNVVVFGCDGRDLLEATRALIRSDVFVRPVKMSSNSSSFQLKDVLSRHSHARTSAVVDCKCNGTFELLEQSSDMLYFNKTYQWLLWDESNIGVSTLLPPKLKYPGLNSQVTYANRSGAQQYTFWDVHSKGRHIGGSLEINVIATYNPSAGFTLHADINAVQGIEFRGQFNRFQLRGASVIDRDNITTDEKIEAILSNPNKEAGVATFVKYHYDLMSLVRQRLNFTVRFRNARGWAGRMRNSSFRLGFLGIMQRNEADVGVSPAFNRLNRFTEFETIHQSWEFEPGFLYRFTPDLDRHGKSGNFLAPFHGLVWIVAMFAICVVNFVWRFIERVNALKRTNQTNRDQRTQSDQGGRYEADESETSWIGLSLKTFAAVCQQGMDPIPNGLPSRVIVITVFLFSLVMYNYYTSSVVGGLLSSTAQGPETIEEIVSSPLKLSFEDIGYYRILFRERQNRSLAIQRLYNLKVLPERSPSDMPLYMRVEDAVPYLKKGGYALHSEVLDAYPEIARYFDAGEICDLRMVSGLLETEKIPWVNAKQSQYTELFRIVALRAAEVGLVDRHLHLRRPAKPPCQALYRVFPIAMSGVLSAFMMLAAAHILSLIILLVERRVYRMKKDRNVRA